VVSWGDKETAQTIKPAGLQTVLAVAAGWNTTFAIVRDPAPALNIFRNADQTISLSWTGLGALEETSRLTTSNWQPAQSQVNPESISITDAMKFFRVKVD
jgi:hypothetical protein